LQRNTCLAHAVRAVRSNDTFAAFRRRRVSAAPRHDRRKRHEPREQRVLAEYLPTLVFLIVAAGIGVSLIVIGNILGPKRPSLEKLSPYECGFNAFEDARMQFDVRYYLIAIQFIIFDLEIIFIVPWTLVFTEIGPRSLVTMGLFVGMLFIGFIYVWKRGALEWE
jgi:NADH-quinone oxidoreductase subunit A